MLIKKKAPNFISKSISPDNKIIKNFNLKKKIKNKNCLLFFWPLDFTFICPTEILSLNYRYKEFKKKNTIILGISTDSIYTHLAWKNTPIEKGGIGNNIKFHLISDLNKKIQKLYKVEYKNSYALRATFLIDKKRIIKHISINDIHIGRNIDEILRLIDAINLYSLNKELCPAQWKINKNTIKSNNKSISNYLKNNIEDLYK